MDFLMRLAVASAIMFFGAALCGLMLFVWRRDICPRKRRPSNISEMTRQQLQEFLDRQVQESEKRKEERCA